LILHPQAIEEARSAFEWYRDQNPPAATAFQAELERILESLPANPRRWPAYELCTRRAFLKGFPHFVVFLEHEDDIEVLAIVHTRRKPGFWWSRLEEQP